MAKAHSSNKKQRGAPFCSQETVDIDGRTVLQKEEQGEVGLDPEYFISFVALGTPLTSRGDF